MSRSLDVDGGLAMGATATPGGAHAQRGAASARPALMLDPNCVIVPGENVLHVITRAGTIDLRGADLPRLHERVAPFLTGAYSEEELVAAASSSGAAKIRHYLEKLRDAGTLRVCHASKLSSATGDTGAVVPAAHHREPVAEDGATSVRFVTAAETPPILFGLGRAAWAFAESSTCVLVDRVGGEQGEPSAGELATRTAFARWLILVAIEAGRPADEFRLYRLDLSAGTLTRLVVVQRRDPAHLRTIPDQLRLLETVDVDQLPLAVLRAGHALFATSSTRYGVHYEAVKRSVLRAFLARAVITHRAHSGAAVFSVCDLGAPARAVGRTPVPVARACAMPVAGSLVEMHMCLVERCAARRMADGAVLAWREVDLLEESARHPEVCYLIEVLRLHGRQLRGRIALTQDGLVVYEAEGRTSASFLPAKALRDLLLDAAWAEYYGGLGVVPDAGAAGHACDE